MNFKKLPKFAISALVGLCCVSMSACEQDNRTEVVFWHTMGQANQEKLNAMIEEFEKNNPDIKITHDAQGGYTDIESKLIKAIPAKTTPTMAFCYPDHVANYIKSGSAVKLNSFVNDPEMGLTAEELKDYQDAGFWSEGSESYGSNGDIYSVPFSKSTEVVFMNSTWMREHKLTVDGTETGDPIVPTKWENTEDPTDLTAMFNLCAKIKELNQADIAKNPNIAEITPLGYDSDDNMFITLCAQYGIPYTSLKEDGTGSIDFVNDDAKALVTRLKGYYDAKLFVTKGTLPNQQYTSTKFKNEELIMSIGSTGGTSYNVPAVDDNGKSVFEVSVHRLPQANEEAPKVISQGPSITFFQNSKITDEQVKASWKFYKHITNTYNSAIYSILTGYEPVRESSYQSAEYKAHLAKLGTADETLYTKVATLTATDAIKSAYFFSPVFVGSSTARQEVGDIISQVMLGKKDVETAFNEAKTETIFATIA